MIWINQFRETVLNTTIENQDEYIDQIRSWHSSCKISSSWTISSTSSRKNQFVLLLTTKRKSSLYSYESSVTRIRFRMKRISSSELRQFISIEDEDIRRSNSQRDLRIWRIMNLTNIQSAQCIRNKFDEHAICLTNSQWVAIMQWARSRARNYLLILFTLFYQKMINSIENLLEQVIEKRLQISHFFHLYRRSVDSII